jgi:hypothetical protein
MEKSEKNIEIILNSINGIGSAEPKPFFYTRLKARMERKLLQPKTVFGYQLKPMYAYGAVIILLILNAIFISNFSENYTKTSESYTLYQP